MIAIDRHALMSDNMINWFWPDVLSFFISFCASPSSINYASTSSRRHCSHGPQRSALCSVSPNGISMMIHSLLFLNLFSYIVFLTSGFPLRNSGLTKLINLSGRLTATATKPTCLPTRLRRPCVCSRVSSELQNIWRIQGCGLLLLVDKLLRSRCVT